MRMRLFVLPKSMTGNCYFFFFFKKLPLFHENVVRNHALGSLNQSVVQMGKHMTICVGSNWMLVRKDKTLQKYQMDLVLQIVQVNYFCGIFYF